MYILTDRVEDLSIPLETHTYISYQLAVVQRVSSVRHWIKVTNSQGVPQFVVDSMNEEKSSTSRM